MRAGEADTLPPVRLSVDDCKTGRFPWEDAMRIEISLDGVIQGDVVAYDCEAGTLTRHQAGVALLNEARDEIQRETVTGVVTVRWRPEA